MTAQIQLPVSAVLPTAFDFATVARPMPAPQHGQDPSEFTLHMLAMELVRYSPLTAQKVASAGRRKMGVVRCAGGAG